MYLFKANVPDKSRHIRWRCRSDVEDVEVDGDVDSDIGSDE